MILSEETKQKIINEYNEWFEHQYGDKTLEERRELGAFFTPPELTIKMIEMFSCDDLSNKTILEPTLGAGGLLAGCIIAGADPKLCFGNEIDSDILQVAKKRLIPMGVPEENLHQGNALNSYCLTNFSKDYDRKFDFDHIEDEKYDPDIGAREENGFKFFSDDN